MNRLLPSSGTRAGSDSVEQPTADGSGGALSKALLGLGVLGVAYAAVRRRRRRDREVHPVPISEAGRPTPTPRSGPGGVHEEGGQSADGDRSSEGSDAAEAEAAAGEAGEAGAPPGVSEWAEDDAHEEPTEPGEMSIDEELVEDVIDEESGAEATGENGAERTGESDGAEDSG